MVGSSPGELPWPARGRPVEGTDGEVPAPADNERVRYRATMDQV
jgi:hypothetical protein